MKCYYKKCDCGMQVVILTDDKETLSVVPGHRNIRLKDSVGRSNPASVMECPHCDRGHWISSGDFKQRGFEEIKL